MPAEKIWEVPVKDVYDVLGSSQEGLSHSEARKRLQEYGPNDIARKSGAKWLGILVSQFRNALFVVLILASFVSFLLGDAVDAAVILSMVVINVGLGFFQEYRAELALADLEKYVKLTAKIERDGAKIETDSRNLVPGDFVYLNVGDVVPADIRLVYADDLSCDEAALTGESLPVYKSVDALKGGLTQPQQLKNMVFMGTVIAGGYGRGIVSRTGEKTVFGKTAAYLKQERPESDFHKNINRFSKLLLKVIAVMTAFIFLTNVILNKGIFESLLFAIALAVGITPESLPIIMTITLSRGALEMAKKDVVIKRLSTVENLGNMDVLCSDKTGTLTEGKISLHDYVDVEGKRSDDVLLLGMLCNFSRHIRGRRTFGSSIDKAIVNSPHAIRIEKLLKEYEVLDENEFDFERRRMSVVVKDGKGQVLIAKGAPKEMIDVCSFVHMGRNRFRMAPAALKQVEQKVNGYESQGYRVIAVAEKQTRKTSTGKEDEKELELKGFLLFFDPPKKTVPEALANFKRLGVALKILSGDSPAITRQVCNAVGLQIAEDRVVTGDELSKLGQDKFSEFSRRYNVFARITPEQKYGIVESIRKDGHIVGFLGDGINDAPALRVADLGISVDSAVGIAKEAADVVLLRKSLRVLATGIVEGRKTFANITKYITNTTSANYGNMFTVALSSLFLSFIPLLPSQILLNNFTSDLPLLAVSTDNVDEEQLKRPRKWNLKLIYDFMVFFGLLSMVFDLLFIMPLILVMKVPAVLFRTAWFVESALSEIIITFSIRTRRPALESSPGKYLVMASIIVCLFAVGVTYLPASELMFDFVKMPVGVLALIAEILCAYFVAAEFLKGYFFRKFESAG